MKKVIIPALALLFIGTAVNAQQKGPQKGVTTAASKSVVHKPAGNTASVSPKKTTTPVTAKKNKTTTKATAIKRKHPRKSKKSKAKAKKM